MVDGIWSESWRTGDGDGFYGNGIDIHGTGPIGEKTQWSVQYESVEESENSSLCVFY